MNAIDTLEKVKRRYPIGTKVYKPHSEEYIIISDEDGFIFHNITWNNHCFIMYENINIYNDFDPVEYWAEIVEEEKEIYPILKLTDKDVIHVETEEQANELCKLFDSLGLKWFNKDSYILDNGWGFHKKDTCYNPREGTLSSLEYYQWKSYTIHKAANFIDKIEPLYKDSNIKLKQSINKCKKEKELKNIESISEKIKIKKSRVLTIK